MIFSIDLSIASTGVTVFEDNGKYVKKLCLKTNPKNKQNVRIGIIVDSIVDLFVEYDFNLSAIVIESGFLKFIKASNALRRIEGALMYALGDLEYVFYAPTTIKKTVAGKGNASKEDVQEAILERYDVEFSNTDESDSFAVGLTYFIKEKIIDWEK